MTLAGLSATLLHAEPATTRYNQATQLRLRAQPAANAPVLAQWSINQPMTLLRQHDPRWCEVRSPDGGLQGFVDCSFLGPAPLTLEQVEIDAAATALAFNRLTLKRSADSLYQQDLDRVGAESVKVMEKLFLQLERHFALSPSLRTYADYSTLVQRLLQASESNAETHAALLSLASSRLGQLGAMRSAFSQDFQVRAAPPVRQALSERLDVLLQQRRHGDVARRVKPRNGRAVPTLQGTEEPATDTSFFRDGRWATGWAGGPLVGRMRGKDPEGVVYSVTFDGNGPWALADVYEMAKAQRQPVKARFGRLDTSNNELSYSVPTAGAGVETLTLELRLPVWAITAQGLVRGSLRSVEFSGDACAGGGSPSSGALVVFPAPVKGDIHGIVASNTDLDPARAVVNVRRRTFLEALTPWGFEATFTHRVDMTVDLDGDGVADLRTVVSNDTSVVAAPTDGWLLARAVPDRRHFRRVGGWYANDVYQLQANENGWWRTLSRYNLVTCT